MTRPIGLFSALLLCAAVTGALAQTPIFSEPLSPRIANYRIQVALDVETKRLKGTELILWHNRTEHAVEDLRFHLYLNGFRNTRSSFIKESGGKHRGNKIDEKGFGFTEIRSLKILPHEGDALGLNFSDATLHPDLSAAADVVDQLAFLAPDDDNGEDMTYCRVPLAAPLAPGTSVWVAISWDAQLPQPPFARTGAEKDFFFVAQWFPKMAVLKDDGQWTDHQFHVNTEFFADYGVYDVAMTVPSPYVLGATGLEVGKADHGDGTTTYTYHAEDVHDFAWTCSPDYVVGTAQAQDVAIRMLCQKEHIDQMQRMLDAAVKSVELFQDNYGDYPFPNLTVVDPRHGAGGAGGMEYPTLITAGTSYGLPDGVRMLEIVTLHEFGHNYWYHLLGSNEWEESWLDEGINTYTEIQLMKAWYPEADTIDWLGFKITGLDMHRMQYAGNYDVDPTVRDGWTYYSGGSYGTNSYSKPGVLLTTLQNHIGEDTMKRVMQTYVAKWRFKHPKSQDFVDVVNEVTGEDYAWYFDQALYTRKWIDYKVSSISSKKEKEPQGFGLTMDVDAPPVDPKDDAEAKDLETYINVVKLRRLGEFTFPVEVEFTYEDGEKRREQWDGKDLWKIYTFEGDKKMVSAQVDPDYKVPLDINYTNNSRAVEAQSTPVTAATSSWLLRLQTLMDLLSF